MFYTRVGRFIAALIFVLSAFSIITSVLILWSGSSQEFIQQRYGMTSWRAIDRGIYGILFSVALGILAEISEKLASIERTKRLSKSRPDEEIEESG